jgi:CheY-like chemotaxis protein
MINLFSNASHGMREQGGNIDIRLSEEIVEPGRETLDTDFNAGRYLRIAVRDTGKGILPEHLDKIFDPFFTTKSPGEGTGMGLAVVHGIVKQLRGIITVKSRPGEGARFDIRLPLVDADTEIPEKEDGSEGPVSGRGCILIVDDEKSLTASQEMVLENLHYEVISETDSQKALAIFKKDPDRFDAVITDQTMPKMTGDVLAKKMLDIRPDLPIILCTGFSETISKKEALAIGVRAFLMKPVSVVVLSRTLKEIFDDAGRYPENKT